jgi:hypothetical protein
MKEGTIKINKCSNLKFVECGLEGMPYMLGLIEQY